MFAPVIASTARKIQGFSPASFNTLVGLDGFVDNIMDVVDKRTDALTYTRVEKIAALGERISRAAGLSSNLELVVKQQKLGGNGPIMANALLQNGLNVSYIGCLGQGTPHPVFSDMAKRTQACYTLCEPGVTDALEFRDGKIMLGKHQSLKEVTYERMLEIVGLARLKALWQNSNLIALTNWTMLPFQTEIWQRLLRDMDGIKAPDNAILFVDLADPEKRPPQEIADACKMLKRFRSSHRVVLGLNQKESMEVSAALGLKFNAEMIEENSVELRRALELDAVVIHPTRGAACATEKGSARFEGPYCANPKLTTGAGDNFNAGFCIGLLAQLDPVELLVAGTGSSGFYVRNARSATNTELGNFLTQWSQRYGDEAF